MQELLPETYRQLMDFVDVVPYSDPPPVAPFCSLVLNFNVATGIHRDPQDLEICLVLVISDCVGGELCLLEPGLVLDLRPGDLVIFPSADISHFNLPFIGKRCSVVLNTD